MNQNILKDSLRVRSAHELIPSTNSVDAHVQDTAVNDELLLNILQALAERPGYYTLLEIIVFLVCR